MTAQSPVCAIFNQISIFFKINKLQVVCVQKNGFPACASLNQVLSHACAKRSTGEGLISLALIKLCEN
jgi:methionine aminopeptidase